MSQALKKLGVILVVAKNKTDGDYYLSVEVGSRSLAHSAHAANYIPLVVVDAYIWRF